MSKPVKRRLEFWKNFLAILKCSQADGCTLPIIHTCNFLYCKIDTCFNYNVHLKNKAGFCCLIWPVFWMLHTPNAGCFSGNETLDQCFSANLKKLFLQNFAANFLLFCVFLAFQHKKCWKCIFRPGFRVCSTQTLVKIYHRFQTCFKDCARTGCERGFA